MNTFQPNAIVSIQADSSVNIVAIQVAFAAGLFSATPQLIAAELDADWSQVRVVCGAMRATRSTPPESNLGPGFVLGSSTTFAIKQVRRAGATARAMLVNAAAENWCVRPGEISVKRGIVHHAPSARSSTFGALVAPASMQPLPKNVALKTDYASSLAADLEYEDESYFTNHEFAFHT